MTTITNKSKITERVSIIVVVIGMLCFIPKSIKAQLPDVNNLSHSYTNGILSVYMKLSTVNDFYISNIQSQNLNDTLKMDICVIDKPIPVITEIDTTIRIPMPNNQVPNNLVVNLYSNNRGDCTDYTSFKSSFYSLSIENEPLINNKVNLFPNPTNSLLNLEIKDNLKILAITLYDLLGKRIKTYTTTERKLNIKGIANGQYILKINTDKGIISNQLIKQ